MKCAVCGNNVSKWLYKTIIDDTLALSWQIDKDTRKKFNLRESQFCPKCKNSLRTREFAKVIMKKFHSNKESFKQWIKNNSDLKIAEINSVGRLHKYLKNSNNLYYSEFIKKASIKNLYYKYLLGIRHVDITETPYRDNSFDVVLHSETLEHVANPLKALKECKRILKPQGICIFTIPVIPDRKTKNVLINRSYHGKGRKKDYLVYWEFGWDFIKNNKINVEYSNISKLMFVFSVSK